MKNTSVALNVVLVIAVAVLYYLHFKKPKEETIPATTTTITTALPVPVSGVAPTIVFINTDSLLDKYSFYKTKKAEFENKRDKAESELKAESDKLQGDAADYQQHAGVMADAERQKTEEQLMRRQQSLMKKKDDMMEKLDNEQSKFSDELHAKIVSYAKEFNKGKNYSYILAYQKGSGIILANDSLDITAHILEGLNKEVSAK